MSKKYSLLWLGLALSTQALSATAAHNIHIAAGPQLGWSPAGRQIRDTFTKAGWAGTVHGWFADVDYPVSYRHGSPLFAHAEVDLTSRWRAGVLLTNLSGIEVDGKDYESEFATGKVYGLALESYHRSKAFHGKREYAAAFGLAVARTNVHGSLGFFPEGEPGNREYALDHNILGLYGRVTLNHYMRDNLSAELIAQCCVLPNITVPGHSMGRGDYLRRLPEHQVNLSTISIGAALRVNSGKG